MSEKAIEARLERLEAALARGLELLESGRADDARREIAAALTARTVAIPDAISDRELEAAFDEAEPEIDQMVDADRVAQVALRQVAADELGLETPLPDETTAPEHPGLPASFATATMAELLERQGDAEGASRIRANLADTPAECPPRSQVISTLERWLDNVRRPRA